MKGSLKGVRIFGVFVFSALALTSCGNNDEAKRATAAFKEIRELAKQKINGKGSKETVSAPDPVAAISATLAAVPGAPLQMVLQEKTGSFAIMSVYGNTPPVVTWVSADKRTVSVERGMLVATRGYGNDLMSVEDNGASELIATRSQGKAEKTYRFLNGLDETTRLNVECTITSGPRQTVAAGEINSTAQVMQETCVSGAANFTNTYWVDGSGRVLQSLQWAGWANGSLLLQRLRW